MVKVRRKGKRGKRRNGKRRKRGRRWEIGEKEGMRR